MARWLFGRKSKRHTVQLGTPEPMGEQLPASVPDYEAPLAGRPVLTPSKRRKSRHSLPAEGAPSPFHDSAPVPSDRDRADPQARDAEHMTTFPVHQDSPSRRGRHTSRGNHHVEDLMSHSSAGQEQRTMSRNASAGKAKGGDNGPAVLKKRLSKQAANAIAREQEIRLMASSPIDIPLPRRGSSRLASASTRGQPRKRRSDRYLSDVSLSVRDSAASSMSDITETYMFKVNAFAVLTPRPIVRHVEPHGSTGRSQVASAASMRKGGVMSLPPLDENYHPKKRIDRLADDLDAGGLRELLERDRRRREKQELDEKRRMQRRLERRAEKQRVEEERQRQQENENPVESQSGPPDRVHGDVGHVEAASRGDEAKFRAYKGLPASWLRDASTEDCRCADLSLESIDAIGSLDGRSAREQNSKPRRSLAASQDIGMSQTTLSHSPVKREFSTPASSQMYGLSRGSTSSASRALDAEGRLSDHGGGHFTSLSSLIRRGSSRLKRRYRERFHEPRPPAQLPKSPTHESFFKSPTPSSAPSAFVPPRAFLGAGTINRPHSRFTEHLSDGPMSSPDSRLQSPDIPEESAGGPEGSKAHTDIDISTSGFGAELPNGGGSRVQSWDPDSMDVERADKVPLSESLASIDSEGSWMSGDFLRRISKKKTTNPAAHDVGSPKSKPEEHARSPTAGDGLGDEQLAGFSPSAEEARETVQDARRASSNVIGDQTGDNGAPEGDKTWHGETRKRPVLVTPAIRPKSNHGLLKDSQSISPVSAEEASPIESHSAELHQAPSIDLE